MPTVVLRPNESQEQMLHRFRNKVVRSNVLGIVRKKRWYVSRTEERRIEAKKAARKRTHPFSNKPGR